jgi:hypothetical protein
MPRPPRGDSGQVLEITFDDVNLGMKEDMVFRPWLITDRVKELDGRRVRIKGVLLPDATGEGIKEFILLKNVECKFGPGGQADHLVNVKLKKDVTTSFTGDRPISVEGVFRVVPFQGPDGNTWKIYDLEAADNVQTVWR